VRFRGVLAAALAFAALVPAAAADHHGTNPPWPQALPPGASPTDVQPGPVRHCRQPTIACVDDLLHRLRDQWRRFDAACDHRAVATLAYLRITQELRRELPKRESIFRYKRWMYTLITTFSNRYFLWSRRYRAGRSVPDAWRITYDAAREADIGAAQDILLFSNAHVQRDLPHALAEVGLWSRSGHSRKPDHDAINEINNRILDPVGDEVARRYDPNYQYMDPSPSPVDEIGAQEMVKSWRETAWRNAERLARADTPGERRAVARSINQNARSWARMIASFELPGWREDRDAYCRSR
jgi:Family of unknown function (DUF5995)